MNIPRHHRALLTGVLAATVAILYHTACGSRGGAGAWPPQRAAEDTQTLRKVLPSSYYCGAVPALCDSVRAPHHVYSQCLRRTLSHLYLFRDENRPLGDDRQDGGGARDSSATVVDSREVKDKEVVRTLRTWMPAPAATVSAATPTARLHFTLMSYNVLAQDLLTGHAHLYRNHSARALDWETRWRNLFAEIVAHDADIICLQEVQESHINRYFAQLNGLGYASVYKMKTGRRADGCALYYRKALLKMTENTTVEFNQGGGVLDRDNVAIVARLAPVHQPQAEFVVATTHLLYNPRRQDVRLAQTQVLLAEVERIAYKPSAHGQYLPVIVTGDFNSVPDLAVYRLLVEGRLRYDHLTSRTLLPASDDGASLAGKLLLPTTLRITDNCQHWDVVRRRAGLSGPVPRTEELKLVHLRHSRRPAAASGSSEDTDDTLFATGQLSHGLHLRSAFVHTVGNDTVGTTHQDAWITVDYVFYSGTYDSRTQQVVDGRLRLVSRYSIPTTEQLLRVQTIPNFALGSDHLALLAKFQLDLAPSAV